MSIDRRGRLTVLAPLFLTLLAAPLEVDAQRHRPSARATPARGDVIARLPATRVAFTLGGESFFFHAGVFYRSAARGFVVVAPPIGAVTRVLPWGTVQVVVGGRTYFRVGGVFFVAFGRDRYRIVDPPLAASVDMLPVGYETIVTEEGEEIYYHDGVFYRFDPGRDEYRIIDPPDGAEVGALPAGAVEETVEGAVVFRYGAVRYRPMMRGGRQVYVAIRIGLE